MPSIIVKPDRDQDFYVEWSTIVEAPTRWGSRSDFAAVEPAERLARADEQGTSAQFFNPPYWGWNDTAGDIYQQQGMLPRANLVELCKRLERGEDVADLLMPLD